MQTLESYIERTLACETEDDLFRQFDLYLDNYGIDTCIYLLVAEHLRAVPLKIGLVRQNLPKDFARAYHENDWADVDPIMEQARREARPFHWFDVDKLVSLNAAQKRYMVELKATGYKGGIAVPVFGPMATIAYFGLASMTKDLRLSQQRELELQFACLQTHNRYFQLSHITEDQPTRPLSPREKEVLSLVAGGLSNHYIAERLEISENTVDTMMRRVFAKLGVRNRICAVLRGIGSGAILPES